MVSDSPCQDKYTLLLTEHIQISEKQNWLLRYTFKQTNKQRLIVISSLTSAPGINSRVYC